MDLIIRLTESVFSRIHRAFHRARGVQFDGHAWLRGAEIRGNPRGVRLGDGVALDRGVTLLAVEKAEILIGARCYINRNTMLDASVSVRIGDDVMIGPGCYITDHDHGIARGAKPAAGALSSAATEIGDRCWIGANVVILKGVTVGADTVVGAGSVVTKPLPTGVVAAGNPALVLRELGG